MIDIQEAGFLFDYNLPVSIRFPRVIFIALILLYAGCSSKRREETILTPTPLTRISTLPVASTPVPSVTATGLSARPTAPLATPAEGVTSTQVNVRSEPSTASKVLGIIPANTRVEIIGKDPGEGWWQINYPQGVDGKGWVTEEYVTTTIEPDVPSVGDDDTTPNRGNIAIVQQQINVRSGPGTDFNSLGTLNPQEVVALIGKDANGVWLQIDFPGGPEGKGWVSAAFVQAEGTDLNSLPIVAETGLILGTGTPTGIPFTSTPTVVPAWEDRDSEDHPIASVIFEATGTQTLIYNGDLSSPQGDSDDWVAFRTYDHSVFVSLECQGNNTVEMRLLQNGFPADAYMKCNDPLKRISVKPDSTYVIHLQAIPSTGNLEYSNYILTVKTELP
jgi:uncharacterized protein YraI